MYISSEVILEKNSIWSCKHNKRACCQNEHRAPVPCRQSLSSPSAASPQGLPCHRPKIGRGLHPAKFSFSPFCTMSASPSVFPPSLWTLLPFLTAGTRHEPTKSCAHHSGMQPKKSPTHETGHLGRPKQKSTKSRRARLVQAQAKKLNLLV